MSTAAERELRPNGSEKSNGSGELKHFSDPDVRAWANAHEELVPYTKGQGVYRDGTPYEYDAGKILLIDDKQTMASCERPWSEKVAKLVFAPFEGKDVPIRVLEFGFGMGITAEKVLYELGDRRRGEYHGVELNGEVYDYANGVWKPRWVEHFKTTPESEPKVKISVTHGEAAEEARRLVERGEKFRIIISDLYPITEKQRGINDLLFLDDVVRLLTQDGVFAFYPYYPGVGAMGELTRKQAALMGDHFGNVSVDQGPEVKPPREYTYLYTRKGAVRRLPTAVCTVPRFAKAA